MESQKEHKGCVNVFHNYTNCAAAGVPLEEWCDNCKKTTHLLGRTRKAKARKAGRERFPISDWQYEVANGDTRLGYADWLNHKLEALKGGGQ